MEVTRTNTILYCSNWAETARFYREQVGLRVSHENDWFVEFEVGPGFLSIADAARATVGQTRGQGVTLSWKVGDIDAARRDLQAKGIEVSAVKQRWGAPAVDFRDPEGHRVELWQSAPESS
jgi:catechol 2,3-dioxygenase-like lactoylglutathione lyase family enzyme